ncbi:MAG: pentapeptide repeat-containing protein [Verrucomicrobiota bacterium]
MEAAPARTSAGAPTPTEKYVLEQIAAGKVANLETAFPEVERRMIRGVFLEELLAGMRKDCIIHRNGVQIEGAIVKEAVDLRNTEIVNDTRLTRCRFEGPVTLSQCAFTSGLLLEGSEFLTSVNCAGLKAGRDVSLQKAVFHGPVSFDQALVTGLLQGGGASFLHTSAPAVFTALKVSGSVTFTNAVFAGPLHLQYSEITDNLRLDGARFSNRLVLASFEAVKVDGSASFLKTVFAGYVSFKDARFNSLNLAEVKWPAHEYGEWLWLNGMTYQRISAGSDKDSWRNLHQLVDQAAHGSAYSIEIYNDLMAFYRREGYPRLANEFFFAQKKREREEVLQGPEKYWSYFLDLFVGYGRSPLRALFWSALIVLYGVTVFRPHRMEARSDIVKTGPFSPFWYSMDMFLPLIKLHAAELWIPRAEATYTRVWGRVHTVLGWALIPIAVAAWTGMLEK